MLSHAVSLWSRRLSSPFLARLSSPPTISVYAYTRVQRGGKWLQPSAEKYGAGRAALDRTHDRDCKLHSLLKFPVPFLPALLDSRHRNGALLTMSKLCEDFTA